ncbi:hypothetical protein F2Q68_00044296 [Brassica cretica]|uniref:Uncharacterized protein n=2 Tax=Brassica cretica TaxID=69181 RepID=A0A8S9LKR4_BRACR|nr:hypothetical protein F2Q68_00044296 [Brassica cretica]KAF3519591.1 hypothetical protein DY000_02060375 [Brassica cretica]
MVVVLFCGSSVQIWVRVLSVLLEEGFPLTCPIQLSLLVFCLEDLCFFGGVLRA